MRTTRSLAIHVSSVDGPSHERTKLRVGPRDLHPRDRPLRPRGSERRLRVDTVCSRSVLPVLSAPAFTFAKRPEGDVQRLERPVAEMTKLRPLAAAR